MTRFAQGPGRGWRLAHYATVVLFCGNGLFLTFGHFRPWWLWGVQFLIASASVGFQWMSIRRARDAGDRHDVP
jgi:hypothetical protein